MHSQQQQTRVHVDQMSSNPYANVSTNTLQSVVGDVEFGNGIEDGKMDSIPPSQGSFRSISLQWNNINYTTIDKEGKEKKLIHNMSGNANPGEMLCIMGTSGAGKSTLWEEKYWPTDNQSNFHPFVGSRGMSCKVMHYSLYLP